MKRKHKLAYRTMASVFTSSYPWTLELLTMNEKDQKKFLNDFDHSLSNEYRGRTPLIESAKIFSKLEGDSIHTYVQIVNFEESEKFCFELTSDVKKIKEWQDGQR